jgi:hypothetical protein
MQSSKKGSQIALFTDSDVRRDYFKSKQWVDSHMRLKVHLTGFACAYEAFEGSRPKDPNRKPLEGRYQGSLHNQQKHAIADAVEWIRINSKYKPRIFVCTTPGFLDHAKEGKLISQFVHNFKKTYGMQNYVWVRELTQNGYPHFHFVADVDKFDPVAASLYWSGLFGVEGKNGRYSIRCGTKPDKYGRRNFWIKSQRMCWYLTKYIGKSIGDAERSQRRKFRTFAISQEARERSQPLLYQSRIAELYDGRHTREFTLCDEQTEYIAENFETLKHIPPTIIDPKSFGWKWTGHGQTYIGFKKQNYATETVKLSSTQ